MTCLAWIKIFFHLICMRITKCWSSSASSVWCTTITNAIWVFIILSSYILPTQDWKNFKSLNSSSDTIKKKHKAILPSNKFYSRSLLCWWINRQMHDWTTAGRKRDFGILLNFSFLTKLNIKSRFFYLIRL